MTKKNQIYPLLDLGRKSYRDISDLVYKKTNLPIIFGNKKDQYIFQASSNKKFLHITFDHSTNLNQNLDKGCWEIIIKVKNKEAIFRLLQKELLNISKNIIIGIRVPKYEHYNSIVNTKKNEDSFGQSIGLIIKDNKVKVKEAVTYLKKSFTTYHEAELCAFSSIRSPQFNDYSSYAYRSKKFTASLDDYKPSKINDPFIDYVESYYKGLNLFSGVIIPMKPFVKTDKKNPISIPTSIIVKEKDISETTNIIPSNITQSKTTYGDINITNSHDETVSSKNNTSSNGNITYMTSNIDHEIVGKTKNIKTTSDKTTIEKDFDLYKNKTSKKVSDHLKNKNLKDIASYQKELYEKYNFEKLIKEINKVTHNNNISTIIKDTQNDINGAYQYLADKIKEKEKEFRPKDINDLVKYTGIGKDIGKLAFQYRKEILLFLQNTIKSVVKLFKIGSSKLYRLFVFFCTHSKQIIIVVGRVASTVAGVGKAILTYTGVTTVYAGSHIIKGLASLFGVISKSATSLVSSIGSAGLSCLAFTVAAGYLLLGATACISSILQAFSDPPKPNIEHNRVFIDKKGRIGVLYNCLSGGTSSRPNQINPLILPESIAQYKRTSFFTGKNTYNNSELRGEERKKFLSIAHSLSQQLPFNSTQNNSASGAKEFIDDIKKKHNITKKAKKNIEIKLNNSLQSAMITVQKLAQHTNRSDLFYIIEDHTHPHLLDYINLIDHYTQNCRNLFIVEGYRKLLRSQLKKTYKISKNKQSKEKIKKLYNYLSGNSFYIKNISFIKSKLNLFIDNKALTKKANQYLKKTIEFVENIQKSTQEKTIYKFAKSEKLLSFMKKNYKLPYSDLKNKKRIFTIEKNIFFKEIKKSEQLSEQYMSLAKKQ